MHTRIIPSVAMIMGRFHGKQRKQIYNSPKLYTIIPVKILCAVFTMTEAEQSARSCEDTSSAQRSPQESAVASANDADAGCTIRIENIPSQIDEYSLNQVMRHFGKARQCRVVLGSTAKDPAEA